MSMCRVFSCVVGRGCLLWPVHSLGKTLLAFSLLHLVLQDQICLLLWCFLTSCIYLFKLLFLFFLWKIPRSGLDGSYGSSWRRQWHPTPILLPGKSHGRRSLIGCSPWGRWGSDMTEQLHFHFSLSCIGEGNGNPLQCSCLENPRDGGAWWAAVYGVAQSWIRLKWLSSSSSMVVLVLIFRIKIIY